MTTKIAVDRRLLRQAQRLAKTKTSKETLERILEEFIKGQKRRDLIALIASGKVHLSLRDLERMRKNE